MAYTAAVITISDKGARGERIDTSGPALCTILKDAGWNVVYTTIIPDEYDMIRSELIQCADEKRISLVLTTGGTGFSPRDITPEATLSVIGRETRGIPEAMRAESMRITPRGCLSRSVAGIRKQTLIVNLPGSEKAAKENILAVLDSIKHGIDMLLSSGSADCATGHHHHDHHHGHQKQLCQGSNVQKKQVPSMEQWLKEAKEEPNAGKVGMYLTHNGVVRETARAAVREGDTNTKPVTGMWFSYNAQMVKEAIEDTYKMDGIYYIRTWLNEGELQVGDEIMYVLIGGDIRSHVVDALHYLVGRIKKECVTEKELFHSTCTE